MLNAADMSTPVTHGDLKDELAKLATKVELDTWGGALLARIQSTEQGLNEVRQRLNEVEQGLKQQIKDAAKATEDQLRADLKHYVGVIQESMSSMLTAYDDKYSDLPRRVSALEARVRGRKSSSSARRR